MWWAIANPNRKGTINWYVRSGSRQQMEKSFPDAHLYEFPTRYAAQTYIDLQGGQQIKGGPHKKATTPKHAASGAEIVAEARTWLGVPYLYGGTTRTGVDCSGLVQNVAIAVGIKDCPRTSEAQWAWCDRLTLNETGPGDLVFFVGAELDPPPGHVGILVTRNEMINAPYTGTVVRYDKFSDGPGPNKIIGYGRLKGAVHSASANPYVTSGTGGASSAIAAVSGSIGSTVVFVSVIIIVVLIFLLLLGAGLMFRR